MKSYHKVLWVTIVFLVLSASAFSQEYPLTILHINDTHSNLAPLGPRNENLEGSQGSIARSASVIGQTMIEDPNVVLLHAGDLFIGDLFFNVFFGVPELQMMLSLDYDAMAVGNHEFDLGPDVLQMVLEQAFVGESFPLLSANLILDDPGVIGLQDYIFPYTIKEFDDFKVGIFGLLTPETNVFSDPDPAVVDTLIVETAAEMVATLTAEECDVIICLSHLGLGLDQLVASYVPGIDVTVGGHSHDLLLEPIPVENPGGTTTWIVQTGAFYTYMGKMQLTVSENGVEMVDYQAIHLDETIPEEPTLAAVVDSLIVEIETIYGPVYSQQITYATEYFEEKATDLMEEGFHDTPVGNLVTDAFRATTDTNIAIEPGGSTAQPLYQGPIVPADIFRMVGYGFNEDNGLGYRLVTFDILGVDLIYGLTFGVSDIENNDEFLIQVSGMEYAYDPSELPADRILIDYINIGGFPIDPAQTYTVTTNEMVPMILNYLEINYSNLYIFPATSEFEVITNYVSQFDTITPYTECRIEAIILTGSSNNSISPLNNILHQNYPNPFNPETTISFNLTAENAENVELVIYNVKGQKVKTLINNQLSAGNHSVVWDGSDSDGKRVNSSIYFYKLKTKNFEKTNKMILLK
ncbi:MAG: 5'-nucleotidase C-terminal domain-containing protein [Armatimonadetes bacterium]|nr:5'-nucleotidase C-terminal domain-containing protein [Armatimonadota bacterium]